MPKQTISFVDQANNRTYSSTKDAFLANVFIEDKDVVKRPGWTKLKTVTTAVTTCRGFTWCAAHSLYYMVVGDRLFKISADLATVTDISPAITTSTGTVFFEQMDNAGATVVMLHIPKATGSLLFQIAAGGIVTQVVAAAWPTTNVGACVAIDNTLYTLSKNGSKTQIHGSALSDPLTWSALNMVVANMYQDFGVTLATLRNQLICFKETSTEVYYDAANALGSPLSRIDQNTLNVGCASASSVVTIENNLIWLSRDQNGGLAVHRLRSATPEKISTPYIDRILASVEAIINAGSVYGQFISFEGHQLYVLTIDSGIGGVAALAGVAKAGLAVPGDGTTASLFSRTLVYDLVNGAWVDWQTGVNAFFGAWCILGSYVGLSNSYSNALIADRTTGDIYMMSPPPLGNTTAPSYSDGATPITVTLVSHRIDFETRNRKKYNLLEIKGDTQTTSSEISVSYSDNDYQTYSTPRIVNNNARMIIPNLGMSRNRAFKFTHSADTPLRLTGFEVNVELMEH